MESPVRRSMTITLPSHPVVDQPSARVRRLTVEPRGRFPLDALIGTPRDSQGLTFYFVGFNESMGPWEAAKCALWAAHSQTTVIACELPGFSRYGKGIPSNIRQDLMAGDPSSWAEWTWMYLRSAAATAKISDIGEIDILAFSTGCSLAVAALPTIQSTHTVSRLTLVEPVALAQRSLGRLAIHNVIDYPRILAALSSNNPSPWTREALRRQFRTPNVRYSPADFLALISMLASDDTQQRLGEADLPVTNLVRGTRSKLCPSQGFSDLNAVLDSRSVEGTTCAITGFGHQLWHCLPAIDALARTGVV